MKSSALRRARVVVALGADGDDAYLEQVVHQLLIELADDLQSAKGTNYCMATLVNDEDVIDPERCPLAFSEFTLKEFERDKEGNWIDDIPDGNDHSIDAVCYAMLEDIPRG